MSFMWFGLGFFCGVMFFVLLGKWIGEWEQ